MRARYEKRRVRLLLLRDHLDYSYDDVDIEIFTFGAMDISLSRNLQVARLIDTELLHPKDLVL
jgi:hypothetical protein